MNELENIDKTIKFTIETYDDEVARSLLNHTNMNIALNAIDQTIFRQRLKHSELTDEQAKIVQEMRNEYFDILETYDLTEII